jgi:polysaccharide deacetylase family protein (PEP-CTERM system associated)
MSVLPMRNALTVDVEDYFQVSAFARQISRQSWDLLPCRVERNMDLILAMFAEYEIHATFFTLGWLAERYPALVRRVVEGGHELASHGYAHLRANDQTRGDFLQDIVRAKHLLEDIGGVAVKGYRAPSFSIGRDNLWAQTCLQEAGYRYSSSVYPIRHDHYGMHEAPRFCFYPPQGNGLLELPVTTVRLFKQNLPAGGGGYFRLLPYGLSRWCLRRVNRVDQRPWEIDPGQPRQSGIDLRTRFRHYVNLSSMEHRLRRLCRDFRWDRMDAVFLPQRGAPSNG